MEELQKQLTELESQKAQLFEQDTIDHGEVGRVNDQIKALQAQIDALNATAQREAIIESHVSQEISFAIAGVDLTDLPVQVVNLVSLIVRSERKQSAKAHLDALDAKDSEYQAEKTAMLETIATQSKAYESLEEDYGKCSAELQAQTVETLRLLDENKEIRQNRKNAADQLEEANKEIEQLKSQISDYQKAKVYGEVTAQKIIDITPESSEANDISAAVAALKTYISVENWGSTNKVVKPDGSFELVKNTELEKDWVPAEATTFPETPATVAQDDQLPTTEAIEPPALPSEAEVPGTQPTSGGDTVVPEVVAEMVSRAEFEELKQRVAKMEAA